MNRILRRHGFAILAAVLLPLSIAGTCRRQSGVKKVPQIRLVQGFGQTELTPPTREIRPAAAAKALPPAAPSGVGGYPMAYANESRNSRTSQTLPAGDWRVRWRVSVKTEPGPVLVLQQGNRILVRAVDWQLLDPDGGVLAMGPAGGGPIVLDAAHGLFYRFLPTAFLAAARLSDGHQVFLSSPAYGEGYSRIFMARHADRLVTAAIERALDPHGGRQPSHSLFEALDLHEPFDTTELGLLKSATSPGELHIGSVDLVAAATANSIVAAVPDCIFLAGWDMTVRLALTGTFDPVLMSLDEANRIYLVVRSGQRFALWLVNPDGERLYAIDLPESVPQPSGPPIVASDHTVYLIAGSQVIAVAPDGKLNWLKAAPGHIGGAIVTADDQLLLAEGDSITAWDRLGQRRVVHAFPGEKLTSPPVLASNGDLLVASQGSLFCLSRLK
jgi:hypothetical protein